MVIVPILLAIVGIVLFFAVTSKPSQAGGVSRVNQFINFVKSKVGTIPIITPTDSDTNTNVDEQTKEQEPSEA